MYLRQFFAPSKSGGHIFPTFFSRSTWGNFFKAVAIEAPWMRAQWTYLERGLRLVARGKWDGGVLRAGQMAFISTGLWVYSCYFLELVLLKMVNSYWIGILKYSMEKWFHEIFIIKTACFWSQQLPLEVLCSLDPSLIRSPSSLIYGFNTAKAPNMCLNLSHPEFIIDNVILQKKQSYFSNHHSMYTLDYTLGSK